MNGSHASLWVYSVSKPDLIPDYLVVKVMKLISEAVHQKMIMKQEFGGSVGI